jgi:hypothetical protein
MQTIEYRNGYKIINNFPDLTDEEQEKVENNILLTIYEAFKDK